MSYKFISLLLSSFLFVITHAATVNFQLDLTWGKGAPDGNTRQMVLMNGGFPGPQLDLDYGDDVQVCHTKYSLYYNNINS
jgi:multicopper oxidase